MQNLEAFISTLTSIIQICKKASQGEQRAIVDPEDTFDSWCLNEDISAVVSHKDLRQNFESVCKVCLHFHYQKFQIILY